MKSNTGNVYPGGKPNEYYKSDFSRAAIGAAVLNLPGGFKKWQDRRCQSEYYNEDLSMYYYMQFEADGIDEDEYIRIMRRGSRRDSGFNDDKPTIVGPSCRQLYPLLRVDKREYRLGTPLEDMELREMIASVALAVLTDAGEYTTIVGEDTSGRIPALIIGKAINILRQRQGLPKARQVFMSGRISKVASPDFYAQSDDDKALLITEYILTGGSAQNTLNSLEKMAGFKHRSVLAVDRQNMVGNDIHDVEQMYLGDVATYTGRSDAHLYCMNAAYKGVHKERGEPHSQAKSLSHNERIALSAFREDCDHFANYIVEMWDELQTRP